MKKITAVLLCLVLCFGCLGSAMARTVSFGNENHMPLYWQVLKSTSEYTKLISEYCIDCRSFGSSSNWASSSLRSWLNNDYLYTAFSREEREAICYVENDLIRIPSVWDMTNPEYGFSSNQDALDRSRSARAGSTAINHGVWTNDNGYCSYYTLTPCDKTSMDQVRTDGRIGVARIDRDNVGVRIVIVVKTEALKDVQENRPVQVSPYF